MLGHGPQSAPEQGDNLYALLGLNPDVGDDEIRAAILDQRRVWRRRTTSPDIDARQEAERRMQSLEEAERTLLDPARRGSYDARLRISRPAAETEQPPVVATSVPARRQEQPDERWLVRALEQLDREQFDVASFTARRAVEADPDNAYAWSVFAEAANRSGDTTTARDAIERALALDPESAQLHAQRGWILDTAGEVERGLSAFSTAARLAPDRPDYRVRAILAMLRAKRVDEAVADAEAAYQAHPDDSEVRSALGAALAERAVAAQHELPDGSLTIVSAGQASYVLALANRGLSVQPTDQAVYADLTGQRDAARKAMRRRFSTDAAKRNVRWPLGFALLSLAACCCAPNIFADGSKFGGAFQFTFAVLTIFALGGLVGSVALTCFEPQHKRNAAALGNAVPRRKGRGPGEPAGKGGG